MSKKYLYIVLFVISIIGLSIVQYQYFKIGLNLAGVQFNEKMGEVTKTVKEDLAKRNELTFLLGKAITRDDSYFKLSLDSVQDASVYFLNDYLKETLQEHGIKTDVGFRFYTTERGDLLHSKVRFEESDKLLKYPVFLDGYLPELMHSRVILELQFENVNRYFLSQLNGLTIPSLIFLAVITVVIVWVFRAFYLQKNLITTTNEFINNLTHELKTPVFSIGVATKILEEKSGKEQKELVEMIRKQVDKLKVQIDKVLELAIIEGKKGLINRAEFDLVPLLEQVIRDFQRQAELEHLDFSSEIRGKRFVVSGDAYHLENAIGSLLENAKKYSGDDVKILLLAYRSGDEVLISVRDEGIGIPEEEQRRIFEKYYRISSGDLHNVKGYGLGLHYVQRIVKLHRGRIKLESALGKGSEFTIALPLIDYE